jgi:N-acetyltransferase
MLWGMSYPQLIGRHVEMLPLRAEHAPGLWEAGKFPEIWAYFRDPVTSLRGMEEWIATALRDRDQNGAMPYAVRDRHSGDLVGSTRLFDIQPGNRNGEIGYTWYTPAAQRTSVNTECKLLLLSHAFGPMDCLRIQFKTCARNVASQKAIERLGAVKEGALRDHIVCHDGYVRTSVYYSILQREWPVVKKRLEGSLEIKS